MDHFLRNYDFTETSVDQRERLRLPPDRSAACGGDSRTGGAEIESPADPQKKKSASVTEILIILRSKRVTDSLADRIRPRMSGVH